jgi:hypothetical protein
VRRRGDVVIREGRPWSATVVALLRHLEAVGFEAAPRVVGTGLDADGNETLAFIEGERADQADLSDDGAIQLGRLIREVHVATASFAPPLVPVWLPWWGRELGEARRVIGHCDVVPWNVIVRGGIPVGLIDWDTAGPVDPCWDLAQAAWLHARLYGRDSVASGDLPDVQDRLRRLRLIVDGYGLGRADREAFVGTMLEVALRSAAQEGVDAGVAPTRLEPAAVAQVGGGTPLTGHDLVWAMTWRMRSAVWMLDHRDRLVDALH